MRNTKLHTICILALSSILTIAIEAQAQLDPNMEASAGCSVNCFFEGNSQASDNMRGLSKIPMQPRLQKINEFQDNPSQPVNDTVRPQFAPVGIVERETNIGNNQIRRDSGSAVIVSPCFVLTNHHVAFGEDLTPVAGKDYSMTFRGGMGDDTRGFAGNTKATPVVWGAMDRRGRNDWALMKLDNCVGQLDQFGWVEATRYSQQNLVNKHAPMAAIGYTSSNAAGAKFSNGTVRGIDAITGMMQFDGSLDHGQSGGALFTMEDGVMKLAGIGTSGRHDEGGATTFSTWGADRSNLAQGAFEILNDASVKRILDADKASFGRQNPGSTRLARPLPRTNVQMAGI